MFAMDEDEYEIPLRDQRYFGAGIKRKRVQFVPSSTAQDQKTYLPKPNTQRVADRYLDIVLKNRNKSNDGSNEPVTNPPSSKQAIPRSHGVTALNEGEGTVLVAEGSETKTCDICKREIEPSGLLSKHSSSIVHQICLEHSFPPNHIDRRRKGLVILESQDWDPDGRRGLGAEGKGILHPIKAEQKKDKAGIGANFDKTNQSVARTQEAKLDAGRIRELELLKKQKGEKLRNMFYSNSDVNKYLGTDAL